MEPEIENIIELIKACASVYYSEERTLIEKMFVECKTAIKQYIENTNILDMYKCCRLYYFLKKQKPRGVCIIFATYVSDIYMIDKYMVEFYKNKYFDLENYTKKWTDKDYEYSLFGCHLGNHFESIPIIDMTIPKIKYILNYLHYITVQLYDVNFIKFMLECKRLGYPKNKIIKRNIKYAEIYDKATYEYYKYMINKEMSFDEFLTKEKHATAADACMDYVYALYNTACDLECDEIIISRDSINQLITTVEQLT